MSGWRKGSERVVAIVPAAGQGSRLGGMDKVFSPLAGRPLLAYCLEALQGSPLVDEVVLVLRDPEKGWRLAEAGGFSKVKSICPGGPRRQDSVREGLKHVARCDFVLIHDGARPFLTGKLIREGIEAARQTGAAVAAVPVTETVKMAGQDGLVEATPPRASLFTVQTPQVFRFDVLHKAYENSAGDVTDDASLVEGLGIKVRLYPGSYDNIKMTNPEDLALAEVLIKRRQASVSE
ncbi:MAG: 2-C-methyl-D-erythritol 4-phosphate cytidylyltransferase [Chloroflexi bacterium]|nr:2-C-methyl-D-erythritol 4-phosphate cytidylyltransferase [Chloroflexota bacterium]